VRPGATWAYIHPNQHNMKKTMLAAALAALAVGSASAETIHITGSTAFRAAANNSINYYVTNTLKGSLVASDNASIGSAGNVVWGLTNGDKIVAYWNGSEAGIQAVAGPATTVYAQVVSTNLVTNATQPVAWTNGTISHTGTGAATVWKQITTNNGTALQKPNLITFWDETQTFTTNSSGVAQGTPSTVSATAQIAFADTYQASSAFGSGSKIAYYGLTNIPAGVINTNNGTPYTNTYAAISNDTIVGGVGFAFIVSPNYAYGAKTAAATNFANGSTPVIANITAALAKKLYTNGLINAAELSGGLDTNVNVYAVGRNIDSGTRVQAMANIGLSSLIKSNGVNSGVQQYVILPPGTAQKNSDGSVYASNSSTSNILLTNWNAELVNGKLSGLGNGGYSSGGTLCDTVAKCTNLPANTVVIGYAGINDAQSKGAPLLSFNGVFPSVTAIQAGNYPFWGYEHLMVAPTASTTAVAFASNVASTIQGLSDSTLNGYSKGTFSVGTLTNVSRAAKVDGGTVTKSWSTNGLPNW
jgi:hypothetical protein